MPENKPFSRRGRARISKRSRLRETRLCVHVIAFCIIGYIYLNFFLVKPDNLEHPEQLPPWEEGYLDIHHLRVGPSVVRTTNSLRKCSCELIRASLCGVEHHDFSSSIYSKLAVLIPYLPGWNHDDD